ncbi:MAG: DUF692 domain-containing protein [Deltaproteobacteria bacterium]|nr:DUF692 domain-containing protein [Deltaproteobacteria bacterium]
MAPAARLGLPNLGLGVGLRSVHLPRLLREWPALDWFELVSENYLECQGWRRHALQQVAERYPLVMHGVSLSIGSSDPLDSSYLAGLKRLAADINPHWVSDHLCWTGVAGRTTHDLLPLPLNESTLTHVVARIRVVQEVLERPLIIENPSSYVRFRADTMPEWEFLARMAQDAECGLLLDVNNVYVSSVNHGFDPWRYIDAIPAERVVQIHLAGHRHCGNYLLDTHDGPVSDPVWRLYGHAVRRIGPVSTLLEWDDHIPELDVVHTEVLKARAWLTRSTTEPMPDGAASAAQAELSAPDAVSAYPLLAGAQFET